MKQLTKCKAWLLTALCLLLSTSEVRAQMESMKVTYTVESSTSVSSSGTVPSGSSATFVNTYTNNKFQMTAGKSQTLTLTGYEGYTITGVSVSTKTNSSSGKGSYTVKVEDTTIGTLDITSAISTYTPKEIAIYPKPVSAGEKVVIVATATVNSLYCESYTITYKSVNMNTLGIPTNLTTSEITPASATLSWDEVEHASSYKVKVGNEEYTTNTNSYVLTGCVPQTTYTWTVCAEGDGTNYQTGNYAPNTTFTTINDPTMIFYESFNTNDGTGGNSGGWSGSIATGNWSTDKAGWVFGSTYKADKCIRVGAGSALGTATTPALAGLSGNAILTFKAGAWAEDNTTLKLSVVGNGTLSQTTVTMKSGEWTSYTINITGGDSQTKIKFEAYQKSNSRFFLDEVMVKMAAPVHTLQSLTLVAKAGDTYYGTFSSARVTFFPSSVDINTVVEDKGKLILWSRDDGVFGDATNFLLEEDVVENGYYVPANTGILIKSTGSATISYYTVENVDVPALTDNQLKPATETMTGDYQFYKLAYDDYAGKTGLGFYWGATVGGAFTCKAGTAYLAVPTSSGAGVKGFVIGATDTADGISNICQTPAGSIIYNTAGQRMDRMRKGINIVNGRKVIF